MKIIVLDSTAKSIKAVLASSVATSNPDFVVAYADTSDNTFSELSSDGQLNDTTDVTLVSAPASGVKRAIKSITIYNRDTAAVTVSIKFDNGGTQRILQRVQLVSGETWHSDELTKLSPGGSDTQVQFNDLGTLAGSSNFTYNKTTSVLTLGANPVLTGGTANGILYLNGSKSATTGSVLTFDGAQLGVNGITLGRGAGAVSTNTAVGASALAANTSGANQTVVGSGAAASTTTGTANTVVGRVALNANTTGSSNVAIGYQAMQNSDGVSNNTAVGTAALLSNVASNNTAVGYQAAYGNTTGDLNTAIGRLALYTNSTGTSNSALGSGAMSNNTTGGYNVGIGRDALGSNTTGSNNVALGTAALYSNTTASNNTAVGYQAGYSNTTGAESVYIGQNAGYSATTNGQNTFVGRYAGYSTTGGYNCFIGYGAGNAITSGTKNTILGRYDGNYGGLDIRTSNNYIVLSDGDGLPRLYSTNTGQVFIPGDNGNRPVELGGGVVKVKGESGGWEIGYRFGDQSNNNVGAINAAGANNSLSFIYIAAGGATSSSSAARFTANGIGLGTTSPATSGVGITFPATQSASSDANTLDDYEEGTFSPTIATSGANVTYTQQTGNYTKVGRLVTFGLTITLNTVTSAGSGDFQIGGLPFASSSSDVNQTRLVIQTNGVDFDATAYDFYAYTPTTSVSILKVLYSYDNGGWAPAQASNFVIAAGDLIVVTGFYYTTT